MKRKVVAKEDVFMEVGKGRRKLPKFRRWDVAEVDMSNKRFGSVKVRNKTLESGTWHVFSTGEFKRFFKRRDLFDVMADFIAE